MKAIKKALTNIRRTPYQSMAAVLVLTITFFVAILISFITASFYQALVYFETRPQILVFFQTDATVDQITNLRSQLESDPLISTVVYVPQEEALQIYQDLNQNDPLLLELVTADILPASLEISTYSLDTLTSVKTQLETATGVDEVVLRGDVVNTLNNWIQGIRISGITFISIMAITSILLVVIVVGMKIAGKQHEIAILQLIGASKWYIQGPFLLEGAFYGVLSSLIAYVSVFTLILYSTPFLLDFAGEVPLIPESPVILAIIFAGAIGSGLVIGTFGSWLALKRYLRS